MLKAEYTFYIILISRGIIDIYYNLEAAGNVRVTRILGILIIGLFSFYFISKRYHIFQLRINKIYGIFLLSSFIPVLFTYNLMSGFGNWLKINQGFFFLNMTILLVLAAKDGLYKKRISVLCWCITIAVLIPYMLFLKNIIHGQHEIRAGYIRYATFGSYGNFFSYCLLSLFPICLFFYSMSAKRKDKIIWFISILIIFITIYKTYTRNAWLGAIIILLTWCLLRKNLKGIFFIFGLCVLVFIFNPSVQDRFSDINKLFNNRIASSTESDKLLSGRYSIWKSNIEYFIYNSSMTEKMFGNGYDVYEKVHVSHPYLEDINEHNNYLTLLMNTGICGLFLYSFFIFMLFRESFKLLLRTKEKYFKDFSQVFISVLFAYVIMCFSTAMILKTNYQYYFSVLAGFVIAANILEEKKQGVMSKNL